MGNILKVKDGNGNWIDIPAIVGPKGEKGESSVKILDAYPVGAVYISTVATSPATLFGGTWERLQDRFLLAAGENYAAGSTGGEANHTLTEDEMPEHRHDVYGRGIDAEGESNAYVSLKGLSVHDSVETGPKGRNLPHNNMPPYLAVYMWKRTA